MTGTTAVGTNLAVLLSGTVIITLILSRTRVSRGKTLANFCLFY